MKLFTLLGKALSAGTLRARIGGPQGVLRMYIKKSQMDSPRIGELISEITALAWKMDIVSKTFQSLGFSYEDYDAMYRAAVLANPKKLINNNLIATYMMIDEINSTGPFFPSLAELASKYQGNERREILTSQVELFLTTLPQSIN